MTASSYLRGSALPATVMVEIGETQVSVPEWWAEAPQLLPDDSLPPGADATMVLNALAAAFEATTALWNMVGK